jgi:hypothetical protein
MGVDFFDCPICKNWVCDASPYFYCGACGHKICDGCAQKYKAGRYFEDCEIESNGTYEEDSMGCPFCSLKEISTYDLLDFALQKLGVSKETLEEEYRSAHSE